MDFKSKPNKLRKHLFRLDCSNPEYKETRKNLESYLAQAFNVEDNPKRKLLYNKAWEIGHSNGLYEVFLYYEDFVDLIL